MKFFGNTSSYINNVQKLQDHKSPNPTLFCIIYNFFSSWNLQKHTMHKNPFKIEAKNKQNHWNSFCLGPHPNFKGGPSNKKKIKKGKKKQNSKNS